MSTDNHNKINGNKDLYERLCTWMADIEDLVADEDEVETLEAFRNYMLDEAMQIMYDIYQTCDQTL